MKNPLRSKRFLGRIVILVISIVPLFEGMGLLGKYEGSASKFAAILKWQEPSRVALVKISGEDYINVFHSTTPLPVEQLAKVIAAVKRAGALRIGVDLDTSDPAYQKLASFESVVWAQAAEYSHVKNGFVTRGSVLGASNSALTSGLTVVATDGDGIVRRYQQGYQKAPDSDVFDLRHPPIIQRLPSFPAACVGPPNLGNLDDILIDFRHRDRWETDASKVLSPDTDLGELYGKIVLIGSSYGARDEHQTPVGWLNGVDILADAVDTEIKLRDGHNYRAPSPWITLSLAAVIACLTRLLFRSTHRIGYYFVVVPIPLMALLIAGQLAYGSPADSVFFAPITFAVMAEPLFDQLKERRKQRGALFVEHNKG